MTAFSGADESGGEPLTGPSPSIREALHEGARILSSSAETPFLDAVLILGHAAGLSKEQILAGYPDSLDEQIVASYRDLLRARAEGNPVSYIRQRKEFYGLEFFVDERVLVPRPDTETLVEVALEILSQDKGTRRIHDACTGSGCVALALARECLRIAIDVEVSASDISESALEVFRLNSRRILNRELLHFNSDLLANVPGIYDMVVSNPPYLTTRETDCMVDRGWPEPPLALDGGADGLALPGRLVAEAAGSIAPGGYLLMEAAPNQMVALRGILGQNGFDRIDLHSDLAGRGRVIAGRRPGSSP